MATSFPNRESVIEALIASGMIRRKLDTTATTTCRDVPTELESSAEDADESNEEEDSNASMELLFQACELLGLDFVLSHFDDFKAGVAQETLIARIQDRVSEVRLQRSIADATSALWMPFPPAAN